MPDDGSPDRALLEATGEERGRILSGLLEGHRERLLRMVRVRMHPQVRTRLDASDVIQEAYLEAYRRIDAYAADPRLPFFLWLRRIAGDRLLRAHRFHLDAECRDVRRQDRAGGAGMPDVSVIALADLLATSHTTPTRGVAREELKARVALLLSELSVADRAVLCMRHFEDLSNEEVAQELGLSKYAASKRYIRALKRLRGLLGDDPVDV